jgi:hypothetical protein
LQTKTCFWGIVSSSEPAGTIKSGYGFYITGIVFLGIVDVEADGTGRAMGSHFIPGS